MPVVDIKAKEGIVEKEKQDSFSKEMVALIADLLKTETDQVVLNLLLIAAGTHDMYIEISAFDGEERRANKDKICSQVKVAVEGKLPSIQKLGVDLVLRSKDRWGYA